MPDDLELDWSVECVDRPLDREPTEQEGAVMTAVVQCGVCPVAVEGEESGSQEQLGDGKLDDGEEDGSEGGEVSLEEKATCLCILFTYADRREEEMWSSIREDEARERAECVSNNCRATDGSSSRPRESVDGIWMRGG